MASTIQQNRVENVSCALGATIRYIVAAVHHNNLQWTLSTLTDYAERSVELYRFVLRCLFSRMSPLLAEPIVALSSGEQKEWERQVASGVHQPQLEDLVHLTRALLFAALEKPNALTLVGAALDGLPCFMSAVAVASPASSSSSPLVSEAILSKTGFSSLLHMTLEVSKQQELIFCSGLLFGSDHGEVRTLAKAVLVDFFDTPSALYQLDSRGSPVLRSIAMLLKRDDWDGTVSEKPLTKLGDELLAVVSESNSSAASPRGLVQLLEPPAVLEQWKKTEASRKTWSHVSVAHILREVGTGCTTTKADSKQLLALLGGKYTEKDFAEVLSFFATSLHHVNDASAFQILTSIFMTGSDSASLGSGAMTMNGLSGGSTVVNGRPLLDAMHQCAEASYDWEAVIRCLDVPGEGSFDPHLLSVIFEAYHSFCKSSDYPPLDLFLGEWSNTKRQGSALMYLLQNPDKCDAKRVPRDVPDAVLKAIEEDGAELKAQVLGVEGKEQEGSQRAFLAPSLELWGSSVFIRAAIHVAGKEAKFNEQVLLPAMRAMPLLFLYTLLGDDHLKSSLKSFVVLQTIMAAHRPSVSRMVQFILPQAELHSNTEAFINIMSELTMTHPEVTLDALLILQHITPVQRVLHSSRSPRLVVAMAMCMDELTKSAANPAGEPSSNSSSMHSKQPGDGWLEKALEGKAHFSTSSTENRFAVAMYVVEIAEILISRNCFKESAIAALAAFLATPLVELLPHVAECARTLLASTSSLYSKETEEEAMRVFMELYESGDVTKAVQIIRALQRSTLPQNQQLYNCVVNILFEESASVTDYPDKALQLLGQLFGSLIVERLLPEAEQERAWAVLLPAIMKPINAKISEFGLCALEQLKPRLAEWPQFCRAFRQLKDLDFRVPGIMATIYRGIKEESKAESATLEEVNAKPGSPANPKKAPQFVDPAIVRMGGGADGGGPSSSPQLHTLNIKALLADGNITSPPPVIQDQINFLVGNTDSKNLIRNAEELAAQLRPEYYEYFAHYLVVKRAALEPNNHQLYMSLVQQIHSRDLEKVIRSAVIAAVKRLLRSDKISQSDSDEWSLLRNVGLWLGRTTIAQDIPLLKSELDFEELLVWGIKEQRVAAVLTFMSRVIDCSAKSSLFAPPNPWTMEQLCLFLQTVQLPRIRRRLYLELEILLSKFDYSLSNLQQYAIEWESTRRLARPSGPREADTILSAYQKLDHQQPHADFVDGPGSAQEGGNALDSRSHSPKEGRGSALQPTAPPFQPRGEGAGGSHRGVSASSGATDAQAAALDPPHHERPPIVLTRSRIRLSKTLKTYYKEEVVVDRVYEALEQLVAKHASQVEELGTQSASHASRLLKLESEKLEHATIPEDLSYHVARSLAANLCYVTLKTSVSQTLRFSMGDVVQGLKSALLPLPEGTEPLDSRGLRALWEPLLTDCETLCLRVLEYKAGVRAVAALKDLLPEVPPHDIDGAVNMYSGLPALKHTLRDFLFYFPASNIFLQALRVIEDGVARSSSHASSQGAKGTPETKPSAEASATPAAPAPAPPPNFVEELRSYTERLFTLITPESSVYIVGPILLRLFNASRQQVELAAAAGAASDAPERIQQGQAAKHLRHIYLDVLRLCLRENETAVRDEASAAFFRLDGRYAYHSFVVELLRLRLFHPDRLDRDLEKLYRYEGGSMSESVRMLVSRAIFTDRVLLPSQLKETLHAMKEGVKLQQQRLASALVPSKLPLAYISDLYPKSLLQWVDMRDITQLIIPIDLVRDAELSYQSILAEFDAWIEIKQSKQSTSGARPTGSSAAPPGWFNAFVRKLQADGYLEGSRLSEFFQCLICFCVEDHATCLLRQEREMHQQSHANSPSGPLPRGDVWNPAQPRTKYNPESLAKCDFFTELFQALISCVYIRSEDNPAEHPVDQRADVTLLRRGLEVLARVLFEHHSTVAQPEKWVPPKHRYPPPADTAFIPIFLQQPYVRLFSNLLIGIHAFKSDAILTKTFHAVLHSIPPLNVPGFAFGWLELVSHRILLKRTLEVYHQELWDAYGALLVDALRFITYCSARRYAIPSFLLFFKAFVKLIVVIRHDYPAFLVAKGHTLYNYTPLAHLQLFNLYAVPWMPEGDASAKEGGAAGEASKPASRIPLFPVVSVGMDLEGNNLGFGDQPGSALEVVTAALCPTKKERDQLIVGEAITKVLAHLDRIGHQRLFHGFVLNTFLASTGRSLRQVLNGEKRDPTNAEQASRLREAQGVMPPKLSQESFLATSPIMVLYRSLIDGLSPRCRYLLLHACVFRLRAANTSEEEFFSRIILFLYTTPKNRRVNARPGTGTAASAASSPMAGQDIKRQKALQEQILRVVLERLLTNAPHPVPLIRLLESLMNHPETPKREWFDSVQKVLERRGIVIKHEPKE